MNPRLVLTTDVKEQRVDNQFLEAAKQWTLVQELLESDKGSLDCFIENAYLHDRLRGQFQAQSAIRIVDDLADNRVPATVRFPISRRRILTGGAIAATALLAFALWKTENSNALAGVSELKRVIAATSPHSIRAYSIDVESISEPLPSKRRRIESDDKKPVKPPLDQAILYIRGKQAFVLMRKTRSGEDFITGSDGQSSWAISPDGPVRITVRLSLTQTPALPDDFFTHHAHHATDREIEIE